MLMPKISPTLCKLLSWHIFIIVLSNYAVQIPMNCFGITSTWGTFTYPFIFITTDLTVRIYGPHLARKVIFAAMIPALIASYFVGTLFAQGQYQGLTSLTDFSMFVFRISAASFSAYVIGQIADILVFSRLRRLKQWWPAPACSSVAGNILDTFVFFSVAFYQSPDPFMAANWVNIGIFDCTVKILCNVVLFVPLYGLILSYLAKFVFKRPLTAIGA